MMLAHPLQRKQLQLFWECFPPRLGFCLWEFFTILTEAHLLGQTLIKAWLTVSTPIHPTAVLLCWGQDSVQVNQVLPHQTLHFAQCSQTSTVLLATTKPRLLNHLERWRSVICPSREHLSTVLVQWQRALYHCIQWCKAWMQLLVHRNPF